MATMAKAAMIFVTVACVNAGVYAHKINLKPGGAGAPRKRMEEWMKEMEERMKERMKTEREERTRMKTERPRTNSLSLLSLSL